MMAVILLAAGLDWLEGLLPAVFVGFWILSQVFALFRRAPQQGGPVIVVQPAPREEIPRPDRERLEREIEEFLLERRGGKKEAEPRVGSPKPVPSGRRRPTRPTDGQRSPAEAKRPQIPPPRSAAPASQPATPAADSSVAQHVQAAFAHDLAHERPSPGGDAPARNRPPVAGGLAALLRDPTTIRQMIVMREVLERPTSRWD